MQPKEGFMVARGQKVGGLLLLVVVLLAGCSRGPRLIGQAGHQTQGPRLLTEGRHPPEPVLVVHQSSCELDVRHAARARAEVEQIAAVQGGSLVAAQNWAGDGRDHATVPIAVPVARYSDA